MTIFSTLLQNVRTMPNKICMREGDNEVSYKRLWMLIWLLTCKNNQTVQIKF